MSFVIPVKNDVERLARCLRSIATNDYPADRVEVVVADNGSTDGSGKLARSTGAKVLQLPDLTISELRNRAASAATGDILAFIDADHEISPDWIHHAAESLRMPHVIAVGTLCHAPSNGTWVQRTYDLLRRRRPGRFEVDWLGSGNMAVSRSAFRNSGGFDVTLQTCEDVDLCHRLRAAGGLVLNDSGMRNVHLGDPSTLGALFRGELWRGRDNLRVSFRQWPALRDLPSVLIPLADLALVALAVIGTATAPAGGLWLVPVSVGGIVAISALRAARMVAEPGMLKPVVIAQALVVAIVYDLARALAVVGRTGHETRRDTPQH